MVLITTETRRSKNEYVSEETQRSARQLVHGMDSIKKNGFGASTKVMWLRTGAGKSTSWTAEEVLLFQELLSGI
jgi:hypothetical protein